MGNRWLVAGLIASVALNLFLIGAAAGVIALGVSMAHRPVGRPGPLFRATRELPQPDRQAFRMAVAEIWRSVAPDVARSRTLRGQAWSAIADPKPDAAAIKAKLAQSRQIDTGVRATVEDRVVAYAVGLPPADRAIFARGMQQGVASPPPQARR